MTVADLGVDARRPSRDFLDEAARALAGLDPGTDWRDIGWKLGSRRDLNRSTIFPMTATYGHNRVETFYKRAHSPTGTTQKDRIWETELSEGMAHIPDMERCLIPTLPPDVEVARTLALDPGTLSSITLALSGRPLGRLWHRGFTAARREACRRVVEDVGRTVRSIEACTLSIESIDDRLVGAAVIDRRMARARQLLPKDLAQRLSDLLVSLDHTARENPDPYVLVHGDLNRSNILVRPGGIGLIDFAWLPRLRGYDVAHFAFRLEYDRGSPAVFAQDLVDSLLKGYGDPELREGATWRFLRLSKLLRAVERSARSRLGRRSSSRALAEIRAIVDAV